MLVLKGSLLAVLQLSPLMRLTASLLSLSLATAPALSLLGQTSTDLANRHRLSVSAGSLLNVEFEYTGLGAYDSPNPTPSPASGTAKTYDDGFIGVDVSGNAGGQTWFWGYDSSAAQYDASGTGTIDMSITNVLDGSGEVDETQHFNPGISLTYEAIVNPRDPAGGFSGLIEGSFTFSIGFYYLDNENSEGTSVSARQTVDSYDLGGVIPPTATLTSPYAGTFNGPGPLISDAPSTRSVRSVSASVSGERELEVFFLPIKLGPQISVGSDDLLRVTLGGGAVVAPYLADYDFEETTRVTDGVGRRITSSRSGGDEDFSAIYGLYADLAIAFQLTDSLFLQASAGYLLLEDLELHSKGTQASVNFDEAFAASFAVGFAF